MDIDYQPFLERSSIYGEVRWPKATGKPLNASAEAGVIVAYGFSPTTEIFLGTRHPRTWEESTEDEYVVRYWGPGIIEPTATTHLVMVSLAAAVKWEPNRNASMRFVDRPVTRFEVTHPSIYRIEPVRVVGWSFDIWTQPPFDLSKVKFAAADDHG